MRCASNEILVQRVAASSLAAKPRVVILGAGNIGCYLGTLLAKSEQFDVSFIGRDTLGLEVAVYGLTAQKLNLHCQHLPSPVVFSTLEALRNADIVLCTVKSTALEALLPKMAARLPAHARVIALQNGVRINALYQHYLPEHLIVRALVPFNVIKVSPGLYCQTSSGAMKWQHSTDNTICKLQQALALQGVSFERAHDVFAAELGKLLLNLNNAINALTFIPLKQQLLQKPYRLLLAAAMDELLQVSQTLNIRSVNYTKLPNRYLPRLLRLPTPVFRVLASPLLKISPEARSSMWDDVDSGRPTEIDFLNGAVVELAKECGLSAPVNQALVERVRELSQLNASALETVPGLSKEEALALCM